MFILLFSAFAIFACYRGLFVCLFVFILIRLFIFNDSFFIQYFYHVVCLFVFILIYEFICNGSFFTQYLFCCFPYLQILHALFVYFSVWHVCMITCLLATCLFFFFFACSPNTCLARLHDYIFACYLFFFFFCMQAKHIKEVNQTRLTLIIDGEAVGVQPSIHGHICMPLSMIGAARNSASVSLADIRFWHRARSHSELERDQRQHLLAPLCGRPPPGLLGYWRCLKSRAGALSQGPTLRLVHTHNTHLNPTPTPTHVCTQHQHPHLHPTPTPTHVCTQHQHPHLHPTTTSTLEPNTNTNSCMHPTPTSTPEPNTNTHTCTQHQHPHLHAILVLFPVRRLLRESGGRVEERMRVVGQRRRVSQCGHRVCVDPDPAGVVRRTGGEASR